jgi:Multicopper oxidase
MTIFDRDNLRHPMIAAGSTTIPLSRRTFLAGALATGIVSTLPASESFASEAVKRLVAGTRTLEVNGRAARVYSLIGPDGRPGIRLRAGERFRVDLVNRIGSQTLVHWHGQLPPWTQDGFPCRARADRLRRRQSRSVGIPLPQSLPHADRHDDGGQV